MDTIHNRHNFHKHTFCVFTEVRQDTVSGLKPDHKSKSGSSYFFTENGVYRLSDHWGRAANCKWRIQSSTVSKGRIKLGYANWNEFHHDSASGKLYYIEMDFDSGTVRYQHKSNLGPDKKVVFRTASETKALIRQVRILLKTDNWARHYQMEINLLRKEIIERLIHSTQPLRQIKSGLLNQIAE